MDLNGIAVGATPPVVEEPEDQAQHSAAPTPANEENYTQDAKTIVVALAGFMTIFYMLHIVERWAGGI